MALTSGTRIGHYDVTDLLGEGGMGQVWQATDTQLNRQVALKILPDAFASDPDRLARFQREAQILASLNHPNIAAIYGIEESEGTRALVLELVEGPTLADRISKGPVPLDEALPIAKQIAEALEAAHEAGVIDRDLKPANIKVREDGTVKVLDFGLAKAFQPDASDPGLSASPTISLTAAATQMGMVIGTAAYMSPEQAKGKVVDKRADVWAFGAVLYEMLTGQRAFVGDDVSDTLAAVLRAEVNLDGLPNETPARLQQVLRACLQRDPRQRVQAIGDVRLAMAGAFETESVSSSEMPAGSFQDPGAARRMLPWAIALVLAVGSGIAGWTLKPAELRRVSRFSYGLPDGRVFRTLNQQLLAVSSDGRRFVYNGTDGLYLHSMDEFGDRLIAESESVIALAFYPFFSPDGQSVGYFQGVITRGTVLELIRVGTTGGVPIPLAETTMPFGVSWESDGTILYGQNDGIWQVSENGGEPRLVVETEPSEQAFVSQRLPDSDWLLFTLARTTGPSRWDEADIVVQSISSGERRVLRSGGSAARYIPTGHLTYTLSNTLFAVPFDLERLEITGGPVPVVQGVERAAGAQALTGVPQYGVSRNGTLVYIPGTTQAQGGLGDLAFVDRAGNGSPFTDERREYFRPRMSPDGARVAVEVTEQDLATQIWIVAVESGVATQLTFGGSRNRFPVWTSEGQTVIFASDRVEGEGPGVYRKAADGSGEATLVVPEDGVVIPTDVSRDGVLAFEKAGEETRDDIWTVELDGPEAPSVFLSTPAEERAARFSPDGRWVAYQTGQGGGDL